jgi:metal-dependent hydrolase (beta-lactamase superfamily II)
MWTKKDIIHETRWSRLYAMWCVMHLLELNEDITPLRETYDQLKNHPCKCTRQQTRRWLQKHFEANKESTSR